MPTPPRFVAVALALILVTCGDSGDDDTTGQPEVTSSISAAATASTSAVTTPTPPTAAPAEPAIEVALAGGQVVGGPRKETVSLGTKVRIRATSDVPEVLHVHTYNRKTDLQPGTPGEVVFEATIPGRHEVEFENSGKDALTLEVR